MKRLRKLPRSCTSAQLHPLYCSTSLPHLLYDCPKRLKVRRGPPDGCLHLGCDALSQRLSDQAQPPTS